MEGSGAMLGGYHHVSPLIWDCYPRDGMGWREEEGEEAEYKFTTLALACTHLSL